MRLKVQVQPDPRDGEQNAFVQSWLETWGRKFIGEPVDDAPGDLLDDWEIIERAVELIQETYSPHSQDTEEPQHDSSPHAEGNAE